MLVWSSPTETCLKSKTFLTPNQERLQPRSALLPPLMSLSPPAQPVLTLSKPLSSRLCRSRPRLWRLRLKSSAPSLSSKLATRLTPPKLLFSISLTSAHSSTRCTSLRSTTTERSTQQQSWTLPQILSFLPSQLHQRTWPLCPLAQGMWLQHLPNTLFSMLSRIWPAFHSPQIIHSLKLRDWNKPQSLDPQPDQQPPALQRPKSKLQL